MELEFWRTWRALRVDVNGMAGKREGLAEEICHYLAEQKGAGSLNARVMISTLEKTKRSSNDELFCGGGRGSFLPPTNWIASNTSLFFHLLGGLTDRQPGFACWYDLFTLMCFLNAIWNSHMDVHLWFYNKPSGSALKPGHRPF